MSTVIAIICENQLCLASDTMASCGDDEMYSEIAIKQIEINSRLAIGFAGRAVVAEEIIKSIKALKIEKSLQAIEAIRSDDLPDDLTLFFEHFVSKQKEHNSSTYHFIALIVGLDYADKPTIIKWKSSGRCEVAHQADPHNFTAVVINPPDVSEKECLNIAWDLVNSPQFDGSLKNLSADYIRTVASRSKFVNDKETSWVVNIPLV